jgi:hypothetical protein
MGNETLSDFLSAKMGASNDEHIRGGHEDSEEPSKGNDLIHGTSIFPMDNLHVKMVLNENHSIAASEWKPITNRQK